MNWVMKMEKVKVDQNICIGCGACFGSYPDCFEMDDNGLAKEKENLNEDQLEEAKEAIDLCPVGAIQETIEEQ